MKTLFVSALFLAAMVLVGCGPTAPPTEAGRDTLHNEAQAALRTMTTTDPGIESLIRNAHAYAIFPSVGKGGVIVGGAYGRGEVYANGVFVGYADLTQANIGLQLGGQTYKELILFETSAALDNFKAGKLKFAADASAVALKAGASGSARFNNGVLVFTDPNGGLMFEAAIGGQQFSFVPGNTPTDANMNNMNRNPSDPTRSPTPNNDRY